jgi:magnesium-protoporphyrin O-methyltransferase
VTGCCPHAQAAGRFFSFFARRYRTRFASKGFEPAECRLLDGLGEVGYGGARVLEIGCGVGHLHQTLLERGAADAVGIDLSPKMLEEAAAWAAERGLGARTRYIEGDFMTLEDEVEPADLTILDRVICCYPDAEGLLRRSLAKTGRAYALVYPRDRWFVRLGARLMGWMLWSVRSQFRPYVHDPAQVEAWIRCEGLDKRYEHCTAAWIAQVWLRAPRRGAGPQPVSAQCNPAAMGDHR